MVNRLPKRHHQTPIGGTLYCLQPQRAFHRDGGCAGGPLHGATSMGLRRGPERVHRHRGHRADFVDAYVFDQRPGGSPPTVPRHAPRDHPPQRLRRLGRKFFPTQDERDGFDRVRRFRRSPRSAGDPGPRFCPDAAVPPIRCPRTSPAGRGTVRGGDGLHGRSSSSTAGHGRICGWNPGPTASGCSTGRTPGSTPCRSRRARAGRSRWWPLAPKGGSCKVPCDS
jgi:hypothetical protein